MTDLRKDLVLGLVLLAAGAGWSALAWATLSPGFGGGDIGPRAFPLAFGVILMGLSALFIANTLGRDTGGAAAKEGSASILWGPALLLLLEIAVYGALLEKIGFVLATPLLVLAVLGANLKIRGPLTLAAMAAGLTAGCWLVFGKLLGIYLPGGTWVDLG
ncbi:tripartite tricarboxylate transporter TctB family protein [Mangrovicoccus sp. HB161399]|uniref:tripartite tricarboxylate transporter TctB family protein n=1 Tax=Mangrovicoccus sp. HB161399 TaxID=2720392 RepID=UPI001552C923|nr:tripartite tricarboxylate transporter TctB family protein [Mangrovicoccus sp. HB161399]